MKIAFYGGTREVTGSCFMINANGKNILVDCGMQQGNEKKRDQQHVFNAADIDYALITHAHIDHCGRFPLLTKNGFKGSIHAVGKACDLMRILLMDSAHIQMSDAEWENKKSRRSANKMVEPLYTSSDVEETIKRFIPHSYGEVIRICDGVKVRFTDAGHLLGSSSIEMWVEEKGVSKKIVFSGDLGNINQPIIKDPQYIEEGDYVLIESTYGSKNHVISQDYAGVIAKIIDETISKGGNIIFPAFAVGRTQELLFFIREIKERRLVKSSPDFPVYVDSPLASEATKIYASGLEGYADEETSSLLGRGDNPLNFPGLRLCESQEESRRLNTDNIPKVIISASGMCDAGRIRHHLKHNLWRGECAVVFVGFQAEGTLGRLLIDGASTVKLLREEVAVRASIHNLKGLSAHADKDGLLKWIGSFKEKPAHVFVVHGEEKTAQTFSAILSDLGYSTHAPNLQEVYDLAANTILTPGISREKIQLAKGSPAFARLQAAGNTLIEVISRNRQCSNKDIAKFASQILELAKKWDTN